MRSRRCNAAQNSFGRQTAHAPQGLPDSRQGGVLKCGALNVIKTNYRYVLGDAVTILAKSTDRADGGNIVEGKQCRERLPVGHEFVSDSVANFGRWGIALQLYYQFLPYLQAETLGCLANRVPAYLGVGAKRLSFDESDA